MSSPRFEAFLVRLYSDEAFAARFIAAPEQLLAQTDLDPDERSAAQAMDVLELQLASRCFAAKRQACGRSRSWDAWSRLWRGLR